MIPHGTDETSKHSTPKTSNSLFFILFFFLTHQVELTDQILRQFRLIIIIPRVRLFFQLNSFLCSFDQNYILTVLKKDSVVRVKKRLENLHLRLMSKWPVLLSAVSFTTSLNRRRLVDQNRKSLDNYRKEKRNYDKRRSLRNGQLSFNLTIGAEEGWTIDSNTILHYSQNQSKTSSQGLTLCHCLALKSGKIKVWFI